MSSVDLLTLNETGDWLKALERIPKRDVSFAPQYLRLFEVTGEGRAECFLYSDGGHQVVYPYIRRPLARLPLARFHYPDSFDIITAHGYGGFLHTLAEGEDPTELLTGFRRAFETTMKETKVVSEFIRFHPCLQNQRGAEGLLDSVTLQRPNVVIDLTPPEDELFRQCRDSYRQGIRKARERGLVTERVDPWAHIGEFARLYNRTMRRLGQTGYLNFSPDFFSILAAVLRADIEMFVVRGTRRLSAAAIILKHGKSVDYFLAGNQRAASALYANHLLLHDVSLWAKREGFERFHLGGGRDSLAFFKSGFSKSTMAFYTGAHVHDRDAYAQLCALRQSGGYPLDDQAATYFPYYRAGY